MEVEEEGSEGEAVKLPTISRYELFAFCLICTGTICLGSFFGTEYLITPLPHRLDIARIM